VLKLSQPTYDVIHDPDLSGPIVIAMALGFLLLLAGKIHFGDIYAMFILGNCLLYCLLNFMSQVNHSPFR
jgi:protein YIPF5/7